MCIKDSNAEYMGVEGILIGTKLFKIIRDFVSFIYENKKKKKKKKKYSAVKTKQIKKKKTEQKEREATYERIDESNKTKNTTIHRNTDT
eukprot:NODE_31428_length_397_cov_0.896296.p1 GENE.NODE_31428_length_397_cov_0.896296~~NODE_31428_length_397_cov_0.896296.p1  ORF type:complete len:89 (-),score=12.06 NODE_31428_length_397_cov_0.896296:30-296(-)